MRVPVTGVRGKTGTPLAQLLTDRGVEVLGGSSDPATVALDGVRPTTFSWDDPSGWPAATAGVDAVFVVSPDRADAPGLLTALMAALPGSAHVVLLSEQAADRVGPDGWSPRRERAVRESGHSWTVLRPSWFMQVLTDPRFYRDAVAVDGDLPFPSAGAAVAWIDARDIAAVAAHALLEPGHDGAVYEITGPEAVSLPRTAELLTRALGHEVTHRDVPVEEVLAGTDGFERELTALTFDRVRAGVFAAVTDTVERVTGRPARSLATFLADAAPQLRAAPQR